MLTLAIIVVGALGGTALGIGEKSLFGGAFSLVVSLYGAAAALTVYVFMGWLQQTLLMLIGIAKNTGKDDILSRL